MKLLLRLALLVAGLAFSAVSRADDLDVIADPGSSAAQRGEAYARLAKEDFHTYARRFFRVLAKAPENTLPVGSRNREPWLEEEKPVEWRIHCTLFQLWSDFQSVAERGSQEFPLYFDVLEDPAAGKGRNYMIAVLSGCFQAGAPLRDPAQPPEGQAAFRINRLIRDEAQPDWLRRNLLHLAWIYGNPNDYLDVAFALTQGHEPAQEAYMLLYTTPLLFDWSETRWADLSPPGDTTERLRAGGITLTPANRNRYVQHCYNLLTKAAAAKQDFAAYLLAVRIAFVLGEDGVLRHSGQPDSTLDIRYSDPHFATPEFRNTTIARFKAWWAQHGSEYR